MIDTTTTEVIVEDGFQSGLLIESIRSMIGTPPANLQFIEYAVAAAVLIILFSFVASLFIGFSKMFGAR